MIAATPVNTENFQASYAIEAKNTGGMEHVILLWSEKNNLELTSDYYASTTDFNSAVTALGDDIARKEDQVQIYPRQQNRNK